MSALFTFREQRRKRTLELKALLNKRIRPRVLSWLRGPLAVLQIPDPLQINQLRQEITRLEQLVEKLERRLERDEVRGRPPR